MGFNFNKGLFDTFGAGAGFQSLTTNKATATNGQAAQLQIRLQPYLPIDPPPEEPAVEILPDETKVRNCISALNNYGQGANVLNAHVQQRLENLLDDMNVATAVRQIDGYINDAPASCANINSIAGTMAGATDSLLDTANNVLDELGQGITDYDAGTLELIAFEALLERVTNELNSSATAILGKISNEAQMLEQMYKTHKQMAKAFSVQALIDDECVRPFLVQLAGPALSQVLVDDFGIEDISEQWP